MKEGYLLNGSFVLNQESLKSEQIGISSIIIVMEFFLHLFEVKWDFLVRFNLVVVVLGMTH